MSAPYSVADLSNVDFVELFGTPSDQLNDSAGARVQPSFLYVSLSLDSDDDVQPSQLARQAAERRQHVRVSRTAGSEVKLRRGVRLEDEQTTGYKRLNHATM